MLGAGMDLQDVFGLSQRAQGSHMVRSAQAENILSTKQHRVQIPISGESSFRFPVHPAPPLWHL